MDKIYGISIFPRDDIEPMPITEYATQNQVDRIIDILNENEFSESEGQSPAGLGKESISVLEHHTRRARKMRLDGGIRY